MIELQKKVFFCYCIKNDAPLFIDAPSLENINIFAKRKCKYMFTRIACFKLQLQFVSR